MFKLIIGVALGLTVAVMFPGQVASQLDKVRGLAANVWFAETPRLAARETEPLPPLAEKKAAGADAERTPSAPVNADPALDYQTPSEERRALQQAQWLDLYSQAFGLREGR